MFVIGLELQPSRLWVMRKPIFGLGSAQVLATTLGIGAAAYFGFDQPWQSALVIGFGLSMSSTALVLQLLAERGQLNSQYGRSAFSILLFQDIAVLPALALLPLLGVAPRQADRTGRLAGNQVRRGACDRHHRRPLRTAAHAAHHCRHQVCRSIHRRRPADRHRHRAVGEPGRPVPVVGRLSWPAYCSRTANSGMSSRPTSSRSRACCSACSSSPSACRRIWRWCAEAAAIDCADFRASCF